ncbi:MAG: class C sortase [Peptoniphilaceae bacterium]
MVKDKVNLILIIFLILGFSLLLYPSIADLWNASRSTKIISDYNKNLEKFSDEEINKELEKARKYNQKLLKKNHSTDMSDEELKEYFSNLNLGLGDVMARLEIPSINLRMPIYHGTDEKVLQSALGHIEWSSLPVGGESSHAVITGHRGLVSARLFTDIDQLIEGDTFNIYVLKEKLTYEVDQISIVEPHEINNILIEEGKDYVTLLTCTPYGINTHRLLVRGHRVDGGSQFVDLSSEASRVKPFVVASVITIPAALILGISMLLVDKKRRKDK